MIEFITVYFRRKWLFFGPKLVSKLKGSYKDDVGLTNGSSIEDVKTALAESWQLMTTEKNGIFEEAEVYRKN